MVAAAVNCEIFDIGMFVVSSCEQNRYLLLLLNYSIHIVTCTYLCTYADLFISFHLALFTVMLKVIAHIIFHVCGAKMLTFSPLTYDSPHD